MDLGFSSFFRLVYGEKFFPAVLPKAEVDTETAPERIRGVCKEGYLVISQIILFDVYGI